MATPPKTFKLDFESEVNKFIILIDNSLSSAKRKPSSRCVTVILGKERISPDIFEEIKIKYLAVGWVDLMLNYTRDGNVLELKF